MPDAPTDAGPDGEAVSNPSQGKLPFAARILIALALGLAVGLLAPGVGAPLVKLGTVILDLIKALAGPLLLLAVLDAFLRTEIRAGLGGRMVAIALINALIALAIGLTISNVLQPGRALRLVAESAASGDGATKQAQADFAAMARKLDPERKISFFDDLLKLVPTSVVQPLLDNAILSIVILAVLAGAALRTVKHRQLERGQGGFLIVEGLVLTLYQATEIMLGWVIQLVPVAVFGVVAHTVGKYGLRPLAGLAVYLAVGIAGLLIQVVIVYGFWLVRVARMPLRRFWSAGREAILYAMGTGSSLASLPVTLRSLDRMGVSPQSARMAACVGTNLNNDGILLYEAMAVLFVAQACGVPLSLGHQLTAAASCALAGIGISGIPEAGLISLLLVLKTVQVVPDAQVAAIVPLLLTVDWVLGRCRAMTNVISDMVVAVLLDRTDGRPDRAVGVSMPTPATGAGVSEHLVARAEARE